MSSERLQSLPKPLIIKLGGSLITSLGKTGEPEVNQQVLVGCAREISASAHPTIILHGTGVFGKPPALRYGYMNGYLGRDRYGVVSEVSCQLAKMEAEVLNCLLNGGLHPFRLPLVSLVSCVNAKPQVSKTEIVLDILARNMTPVIGGNFVLDEHGFSVYSSDSIAADLAVALSAKSLILATRAHGVYRRFGVDEDIYHHLSPADSMHINKIRIAEHDVSGGIRKKIFSGFRAAECGIPTFIIDGRIPDNLSQAIEGNPLSGTQLHADVESTKSG